MNKFGIDVSSYQKGFSFLQAQKEGVTFAILRAGFTGYGDGFTKNKDKEFETFYKECKKVGIPVGAYWYSCATSYEKGKLEAIYLYENCLKGKEFLYPIYIDVEDTRFQQKAGKKLVTEAIKGFCEYLEAKNFYVGIYANSNWFTHYIDLEEVASYDKWVANWGSKKPTSPYAGMWQFGGETNLLRSNQIASFTVDQNYAYIDYPKIIKSKGLNGLTKTSSPLKNILEITYEVLSGNYGNGKERKEKLEEEGYNYLEVQQKVNALCKEKEQREQIHIVVKGDSLFTLARKYNTTITKLIDRNKEIYPSLLTNPSYIQIGWKLKIK